MRRPRVATPSPARLFLQIGKMYREAKAVKKKKKEEKVRRRQEQQQQAVAALLVRAKTLHRLCMPVYSRTVPCRRACLRHAPCTSRC